MATRSGAAVSGPVRWERRSAATPPPRLGDLLLRQPARDPPQLRDGRRGSRDLGLPALRVPAGQDADNPPAPPKTEPYKTHLAYVKERRSDEDGEAILEEALAKLREKRAAVKQAMQAAAR